ncbi:hypothetical protein CR513_16455, partial [Mucuna pruriens]
SLKGLRHGDPLAPTLFIIVAEGVMGLMRQVVKDNSFTRCRVKKENVDISLLQFVDDTLFFTKDSMQNVIVIKSILSFIIFVFIFFSFFKIPKCVNKKIKNIMRNFLWGGEGRKILAWVQWDKADFRKNERLRNRSYGKI